MIWVYLGLAVLLGFAIALFFVCLAGANDRGRGGTIDLAASPARGDLDLDWSDPRSRLVSDEKRAQTIHEVTRPVGGV